MSPRTSHMGFKLPEPDFNSPVTDLVMDLEFLKRVDPIKSTEHILYQQLREIFRDLDSIASARIDGNKTGLTKFLESKLENPEIKGRKTVEIDRISEISQRIEETINETVIYKGFFIELHKLLRDGITKDSTRNIGKFRRDVKDDIGKPNSSPEAHLIDPYLTKLISLSNKKCPSKYHPLKIAMTHHKLLWIHPFREANGLLSRLFSHFMLMKNGFKGNSERIINPSFSLASDPEKYLYLIKKADSGINNDIMNWYEFALTGLRDDMSRMDLLHNYNYLKEEVIAPALNHPLFERLFTDQDRLIMDIAIEKQVFQAADIRVYFPSKHPSEISKMLRWLKEKELIISIEDNSRRYAVNLQNKYLVKQIIAKLDKKGFLPFEK
ncbi:MAG: Fic family protein [Bacteroidales bacterium]|nr:Fic family protein [Bacteroidales bacterium]